MTHWLPVRTLPPGATPSRSSLSSSPRPPIGGRSLGDISNEVRRGHYHRGSTPAGCAFFPLFSVACSPKGTISPWLVKRNSASPQVIRFEKKLATHTAKCRASRSGTSHSFRRAVSSRSPHTPTVHATASRKTRYVTRIASAPRLDRLAKAPTTAHGKPCVNNNPMYEVGRHSRTVRAQRNWCSQNFLNASAGYIVDTTSRDTITRPPAFPTRFPIS